ncbi:hypothetical protein SAMN05216387_10358 [Nitrosovibrio tenuis]|uniref:Uncharacterized protein n=1 Tax=Nitrosovibrio tenuis TaxID=1233 RepID=A0A1H7JZR9_9PROT|nr:hypothetical protein SAMN05216387_10358 [Nitrosovibrio tenuis]
MRTPRFTQHLRKKQFGKLLNGDTEQGYRVSEVATPCRCRLTVCTNGLGLSRQTDRSAARISG